MATLRMLKKDIDYLTAEVLSDSYSVISLHPERKEKVFQIMEQVVDLHNNLIAKVNNPPVNGGSLVKKHYAQIRREMMEGVDKLFNELSSVSK